MDVLPDAVQGWFVLEKCGLDFLERSVIQADLRSNFTLAGVENSLRSHWTDEQVRKRDGEPRHQANFQMDGEEISEPEADPEEAFFENWSEQDVAWWQEACTSEHQAWLQYQHARRSLKHARARQHEVKMGRHFYRGKGSGANPRYGPCLKCGGSHPTSNCPGNGKKDEAHYGSEQEGQDDTTFYQDFTGDPVTYFQDLPEDVSHTNQVGSVTYYQDFAEDDSHTNQVGSGTHYQDFTEDASHTNTAMEESEQLEQALQAFMTTESKGLSTSEAVRRGMAVLDGGATRTMASAHAIEQLAAWNQQHFNQSGITKVDATDTPVFGFGNSETAKCISTCYLRTRSGP